MTAERTILLVVHTGREEATEVARRVEKVLGDNGISLRVLSAEYRGERRVRGRRLRGLLGWGAFEQPGDEGGQHLDVGQLFGADVHDEVLVLTGDPAVPALE